MTYLILNLWRLKNILLYTLRKGGVIKNSKKECYQDLKNKENLLRYGTQVKMVKNGTQNTLRKLGKKESLLKRIVRFVEKNIIPFFLIDQNTVTKIVELKNYGKEDVYNITVEKDHNYYANGILVKNCDAIRYGLDSFRRRVVVKPQTEFGGVKPFFPGIG